MKYKDYKYGTKMICIDNYSRYSSIELGGSISLLKIGETYTFNSINSYGEINFKEFPNALFRKQRFIEYSKFRKYKLEKLNNIKNPSV